ncbi:serine--tRNA ligase [Candidatus Phytoplasma australiense]|uniref:Serine--tRNA ligase n=1 Tax=Strawberry lethal yellows phytoplasma (CPA) str. NZSb11 TaxID=980422 RepID=R4RWR8_PHYAS|nr:serine--tRNA ligase [Candidatus Phytoplasma australiense]AGL90317.1 Seryl-tRNA synthetase [Strawberry lethal yellows phytoplasma (CPA) str. NZSb11]
MLDLNYVVKNLSHVLTKLETRNHPLDDLKKLPLLSSQRKELLLKIQKLRQQKNKTAQINATQPQNLLKKDNDKSLTRHLEEQLKTVETAIYDILSNTPNLPHDSLPIGKDEQANQEISRHGVIPQFDFPVKDHVALAKKLDILDFEKAAKITGSRFVVCKGLGARLERALIQFMMDLHSTKGYQEIIPPYIINEKSMFATGQLPKFEAEVFKISHHKNNWYLNPTAEVPTINLHRDEFFPSNALPLKYVAYTTSFRQEAGSAGSYSRGIFRQHQFNKVELIQFCHPQNSYSLLDQMLQDSCAVLDLLKLPYRVIVLSTGDLGFGMSKTYDIEVFIPSSNCYREIASISNSESFQSRRANIKFHNPNNNKKEYLHILNGSGLAIGRTVIAILENYQNSDGTIRVPEVLIPFLGTDIIKR